MARFQLLLLQLSTQTRHFGEDLIGVGSRYITAIQTDSKFSMCDYLLHFVTPCGLQESFYSCVRFLIQI